MSQLQEFKNFIILLMGFSGCEKLTVAQELLKYPYFKLVDNHLINNPILSIIEQDGKTPLSKSVWEKVDIIRNTILDSIKELSPKKFSFIFTAEMLEGNDQSKSFFNKIKNIADERQSIFVPVRLICDEDELVRRIQNPARQKLYKDVNPERASKLFHDSEVFESLDENQITINNTKISPIEVSKIILDHINKLMHA